MANLISTPEKKRMQTMRATYKRSSRGVSIVELGAALAFGLPLVIALLYVTLETSHMFAIRTNIDIAARNAARALAIEYGKNPSITTASPEVTAVLTANHIHQFVENNAQFTTTFNAPTPSSVTVTCVYPAHALQAAYGLPKFPNPDPLNLGSTFVVGSTATFMTE